MSSIFKPILLALPLALCAARPVHAQTVLFNEQFDTPARWSTATKSAANVARYKGTDWLQYAPLGNITSDSFNLNSTEWGNPPVLSSGDGAEGHYLRFKLSTFNPNNTKPNRASKYLWGTELQTLRKFGPPALGHAIDFESRLRLPSFGNGMIGSLYTYSQKQSGGTVFSDEIDFEYLGLNPNQVQLTCWNDWARRNDTDTIAGQAYGDSVHHHNVTVDTVDRSRWHFLKIRWVCFAIGQYRTEFYTKQNAADAYVLRYTESGVQPNEAMEIHLNLWAFGSITDAGLIPTSAPGTNYLMDVDWCRASDVTLSAGALQKPKPSNGRS